MNYSRGNAGDGGEAAPGGLVPVSQQALLGRDPYSIAVPYGVDTTADATPVFGLSLHEYLRVLIKRKWLILSILGVAVVIGTLTTLMKTPLYTSTVRMQIDPNTAKIVQSGDVTPTEGANADFMRTQFELLNGRTMAERVASALKLGEDQDFFRPRNFSITGAIFKIIGLGAFRRRNRQQVRPRRRRRRHRARQQGGAAGHGLATGRHRLFGSQPVARATHCIGLCRRLRRLQSRQAVSGQFLCQGLSRGPAQDLETAARGFGKDADRVRPKGRDRRDQRQGVDCGNQFGQRQCRAWRADLRSNQERAIVEAAGSGDRDQSAAAFDQSRDRGAAHQAQYAVDRISGQAGDLQAELSGDDAAQQPDCRDRPAACDRAENAESLLQGGLRVVVEPRKRDEAAGRDAQSGHARSAKAQHRVQYSQARSRHQPVAL